MKHVRITHSARSANAELNFKLYSVREWYDCDRASRQLASALVSSRASENINPQFSYSTRRINEIKIFNFIIVSYPHSILINLLYENICDISKCDKVPIKRENLWKNIYILCDCNGKNVFVKNIANALFFFGLGRVTPVAPR